LTCRGAQPFSLENRSSSPYHAAVDRLPFKALFCEKFGCPPEVYEERAFWKCLYWHARFLAPVIRKISPDFFFEDFKFIRYLGDSLGVRDASVDIRNFGDVNRRNLGFLRTGLKIRVSGQKASRLVHQLFPEAQEAEAAAPPQRGSSIS
jgi:hypothetical protein